MIDVGSAWYLDKLTKSRRPTPRTTTHLRLGMLVLQVAAASTTAADQSYFQHLSQKVVVSALPHSVLVIACTINEHARARVCGRNVTVTESAADNHKMITH